MKLCKTCVCFGAVMDKVTASVSYSGQLPFVKCSSYPWKIKDNFLISTANGLTLQGRGLAKGGCQEALGVFEGDLQ